MRTFSTGATRDSNDDKYNYEGFLSPIVLREYAKYMHKNRVQTDGSIRAADNWQNHFGDDHFQVCMESAWRHFHDMWLEHRGYKSREGMDEAINGLLFNVMAYADKYYKDRM